MKNIFLGCLVILSSASSKLKSQNTIQTEEGEYFIKIDQQYLVQLSSLSSGSEHFNSKLDLSTYRNRFAFLNANTALNIDYNDITYTYVKKFLSYRWYPKVVGLSAYYFPLFESKLDRYGVPRELKYLAVVESALNPRAGSRAGASGLWQFMPATGAQYGLRKTPYINTFYDPVSNADAGARYLRDLYKMYKDWNLAISAYNCGPGNLNKAIRLAGTRDYWKLRKYLPKETQAYVPSFVAVNYLFNFYKEHQMKPQYFRYNFFDLKMIRIEKTTTFRKLAKIFDYSLLKFANPQFVSEVIPAGSLVYVKEM
ncbi:lytic transglycosylase domain-containing protein [Kaistella palustris]|uniref:lytic transglycosylase domain-containing protein n=1 Tax=Kaistella palustris TaxID=493376 RepID=UPI00040CE6F1|nr:lytic transglycosylase domain-containing protein [Kaistella palustris]